MPTHSDVAIVGAGIAGLALASRLAGLGLRVRVHERATTPRVAGAGVTLHPNALASLGPLAEAVSARGRPVVRQVVHESTGGSTVVDWGRVWADCLPVTVARQALHETLLGSLGDARLHTGSPVEHLAPISDLVEYVADGQRRTASLLVGADGVGSVVRRHVSPDAEPVSTGPVFYRALAGSGGEEGASSTGPVEWRVWRHGSRSFGTIPVSEHRCHVFAHLPIAEDVAQGSARERMHAVVREIGPGAVAAWESLEMPAEVDVRTVVTLTVRDWVRGRLGLLGDAAHTVSPATTQGAGLALEDAQVLAEEIARHGTAPAALAAYQDRRRPRVEAFLRRGALHAALTSQPAPAEPLAAPRDGSAWFRRLYEPLLASP